MNKKEKLAWIVLFVLSLIFLSTLVRPAFGNEKRYSVFDCDKDGDTFSDTIIHEAKECDAIPPSIIPSGTFLPSVSPTDSPDASVSATVAPQQTDSTGGGGNPPTFNTGGDGRSDGRSSCPSCTKAPSVPFVPQTGHAEH